jgi:hypothetical protein
MTPTSQVAQASRTSQPYQGRSTLSPSGLQLTRPVAPSSQQAQAATAAQNATNPSRRSCPVREMMRRLMRHPPFSRAGSTVAIQSKRGRCGHGERLAVEGEDQPHLAGRTQASQLGQRVADEPLGGAAFTFIALGLVQGRPRVADAVLPTQFAGDLGADVPGQTAQRRNGCNAPPRWEAEDAGQFVVAVEPRLRTGQNGGAGVPRRHSGNGHGRRSDTHMRPESRAGAYHRRTTGVPGRRSRPARRHEIDRPDQRQARAVVTRGGRPFVSGVYQARYCSDRCRNRALKRAYRERLRDDDLQRTSA